MPYIVKYQKVLADGTTYQLNVPEDSQQIAEFDGYTYVSIPDGSTIPSEQPSQISYENVVRTAEIIAEIKENSPNVKLINTKMIQKIREKYTVDDELFFARIAGGVGLGMYELEPGEAQELQDYKNHVENVREWGRTQRELLGLVVDA